MDKKTLGLTAIAFVLLCTTVYGFTSRTILLFPTHYKVVEENHYTYVVGGSSGNVARQTISVEVHANIKQWRWIDGEKYLIYSYEHPAALTQIGENYTGMKISGDVAWPYNDEALYNVTFIALGHDVGLGTTSTVLPGEWNRTAGTFEYIAIGQWNYTASFFPSGSGSTNSTSLNWKTGIATDNCMWCYDTFTTIDYTSNDQIDVEWGVDVQYS